MSIFKLGMGSSSMPGQTKKKARHEAGTEEHLQAWDGLIEHARADQKESPAGGRA